LLKNSNGRENMADRPFGIAILAVLNFLAGFLALLLGITLLGFGALLSAATLSGATQNPQIETFLAAIGALAGVIVLILAIIILLIGRGLWKGSNWARILIMIFLVLGVLSNAWSIVQGVQLSIALTALAVPIVSLLIGIFFLYYLTRSNVTAFFA